MAKKKKKRHNTMRRADWTIGQNAAPKRSNTRVCNVRNRPVLGKTFINPYNFVRVAHDPGATDRSAPTNTHEQFHEGCFSGRIECRLEVITPLFIPDPGKREPAPNGNPGEKLFFNRDDRERPTLPATSLKGMVRNVFETVTHSCLSQLNQERLDYRNIRISQDLTPALIIGIDNERRSARIARLDGMAWLPAYPKSRNKRNGLHKKIGTASFAYANIKKDRYIVKCRLKRDLIEQDKKALETVRKQYNAKIKGKRLRAEDLSKKQKDALQKDLGHLSQGRIQVINYNLVTAPLQDDPGKLPPVGPGEGQYQALIKHTGKTIPNKHDERVFFSDRFKTDLEENLENLSSLIPYDSIRDMDYVLNEQYQRWCKREGEQAAEKQVHMRLNRAGTWGLKKGDLVYYYNNSGKKRIALVLVPRLRYERSPADLLPDHLRPCISFDCLCPACRMFGMVGKESESAYKGKVSFSDGVIQDNEYAFQKDVLLKILGSSQPTSTNFYLIGKDYDNNGAVTIEQGGYDKKHVIPRGRKIYWLQGCKDHPLPVKKYQRSESDKATKFDKWVELLKPKGTFTFHVDFENLTMDVLSMLVWSLELDTGMYHSLGMGKPLGLGTVRIQIKPDKSFMVGFEGIKKYYEDFTCKAADVYASLELEKLKKIAASKFEATEAYLDLKKILSYDETIAEMVAYPQKEKTVSGQTQYLGYAWFMDNRHQPLLTIEDIVDGKKTQTGWQGGAP